MAPYRFFTSVTRHSDLWCAPFDVAPESRSAWDTGDFVVGRVVGERSRLYQCETKTGRMADMVRGDQLVGALGRREATQRQLLQRFHGFAVGRTCRPDDQSAREHSFLRSDRSGSSPSEPAASVSLVC